MSTTHPANVPYRISKSHGRIMVLVALLFDTLPMILVILAVVMVFNFLNSDSGCANYVMDVEINGESVWSNPWDSAVCAKSVAGAGIIGFLVGPAIYLGGSFFATLIAFCTFTCWFFVKRVNPFKFSGGHVGANLIVLIFEFIPGLNLLPGITLATYVHVKASQKYDARKHHIGRLSSTKSKRR